MKFTPLAFDAPLTQYEAQAESLLDSYEGGDASALNVFRHQHPRFLDEKVTWLSLNSTDEEIRAAKLGIADAQLVIARLYNFKDWNALKAYAESVRDASSPVFLFESAVEAVIHGDVETLGRLLREHPELVNMRSTWTANFDPPNHRATLLHYVAANGVEGHRQVSPKNSAEVARMLLEAGAKADEIADMYGSPCTTMQMLVSSCHPAKAGVQVDLVHVLLDYGAEIDGLESGRWGTPLDTAIVFGYPKAAQALVERGARVDRLPAAAGLGRVEDVRRLLPDASEEERHKAIAVAAQSGHIDVVKMLVDAGVDLNRYNPEGHHAHSTPLHQAVAAGHLDMVKLLVERGARLDIQDTLFKGTPLGWARYCEKPEIAAYLETLGAEDP